MTQQNNQDNQRPEAQFKRIEVQPRQIEKQLQQVQDLTGMIEVITDSSTIKAINPKTLYDQIKIEDDGTNRRLWVYVPTISNTNSSLNWKNIVL